MPCSHHTTARLGQKAHLETKRVLMYPRRKRKDSIGRTMLSNIRTGEDGRLLVEDL